MSRVDHSTSGSPYAGSPPPHHRPVQWWGGSRPPSYSHYPQLTHSAASAGGVRRQGRSVQGSDHAMRWPWRIWRKPDLPTNALPEQWNACVQSGARASYAQEATHCGHRAARPRSRSPPRCTHLRKAAPGQESPTKRDEQSGNVPLKKTIRQLRQESGEPRRSWPTRLTPGCRTSGPGRQYSQPLGGVGTRMSMPVPPAELRSSHPGRPARRSGRQKFVKNGPDDVADQGATRVKARSSRARRSAGRGWSISSRVDPRAATARFAPLG